MNTSHLAIAVESSQSVCELETFIKRLIQDTKDTEKRLKNKKDISDRSASAIKKMSALEQTILDNKNKIIEAEAAKSFVPDSWVVRGRGNKPGQVVKPQIAGKTLAILVLWDNATAPVPERVARLNLVDGDKCRYIWNGDRYSKLVRPIDGRECDNLNVLSSHLNSLEAEVNSDLPEEWQKECQSKITYLRKRIEYFNKPWRDRILISKINRNGSTQQRSGLNSEVVIEYAELLRSGVQLPPVKLFFDGHDYWLSDGHHTTEAAWSIGEKYIDAEITRGTEREAILASAGVNSDHGLRRSNADKRKAVTTLLLDSEWGQWSDREVAKRCNVSNTFVSKMRKENLTVNVYSDNPKKYKDKHGNIGEMNTKNIGSTVQTDCPDYRATSRLFCGKRSSEGADAPLGGAWCESTAADEASFVTENATYVQTDYPGNKTLVENFNVGQLVQIKSDRANREDKRLIGLDLGVATVIKINPSTLTIKIWGQEIDCVSINDLTVLDENNMPAICLYPSADDYRILNNFSSKQEIIKAANAARSLAI